MNRPDEQPGQQPADRDGAPGAGKEPGHPAAADEPGTRPSAPGRIVSVNERSAASGNRTTQAVVLVLATALLLGLALWFFQNWAGHLRDSVKASSQSGRSQLVGQAKSMLNPEDARTKSRELRLGADAQPPALPPPSSGASAAMGAAMRTAAGTAGGAGDASGDVRALRGPDGGVLVSGSGRALGVDRFGQVVEVPAIEVHMDGPGVPLADEAPRAKPGPTASRAKPPASRYGGALLADGISPPSHAGETGAPTLPSSTAGAAGGVGDRQQAAAELLRSLTAQRTRPDPAPGPAVAGVPDDPPAKSAGPVAAEMRSSATPVARARQMTDQTLLLPKGRQADCVLTTRIVNELPGFTSCALTQNMYSADGKVLLLERGSEVSGEYGVSSQLGLRRLFIVWTRVRTPSGVEVDLRSPGADALGTSGVPGHLEQRWTERIGAALLLSVMRDAFELEIARQQADRSSSSTVVLGPTPGGNTMQAGQDIGEQVVKQTLNVKPTLHIAEGARISIHVARDLDFSPVYALRSDRAARSLDSSFTGRTP